VTKRATSFFWIAGIVIVAIVAYSALRGGNSSAGGGPQSLAGHPAPSFRIASTAGGFSALDAYRGRIVVMNLWASWCPPCRAEMPDLQRLSTYDPRDVTVLGINEGESAQRAAAFARSLGIRYPILLDQEQQYGRVYAALGLPTTVIVGRDGTVVRGFDGPLSYAQMVDAVSPLIKHT
jgi:cytochrome c biogenesis protein CcmG/thiol:disulfide interchange protein DsbE